MMWYVLSTVIIIRIKLLEASSNYIKGEKGHNNFNSFNESVIHSRLDQ